MKKADFLHKIIKEGKLQLVEQSEIMQSSYLKKSESYLASAKILLQNEKLEESVAMIYYSMYYITLALFFRTGIKSENHTATIILLKDIFKIDNSALSFAKTERLDKQYYVDFHIAKEEIDKLIERADKYNAMIYDFMEKLNNDMITEFRQKFSKAIK